MIFSKRSLRGIVLGLVIASVPVLALATDRFTDVPTTHFAHDAINRVAGAGITTGCTSATLFCPDDSTTRGQMAAFLSRGLGRVAYESALGVVGTASVDVVTATITPGGTAAGVSMVEVDATATVTCSAACNVDLTITDGTLSSRVVNVTLAAAGTSNVALNWADEATTPGAANYSVHAATASTGVTIDADISALSVAFGPDGGNLLQP